MFRFAYVLSCLLVLCAACRGPAQEGGGAGRKRAVERKGVRARVVEQTGAKHPGAKPGDIVLEGPQLSVRVDGPQRAERRSLVIALDPAAGGHEFEAMLPRLSIAGRELVLNIASVEPGMAGDRPAIIVRGSMDMPERSFAVTRVLRIADVGSSLRVTTRIALARGTQPRELALIEQMGWGGESPVAPLAGPLRDATPVHAEWIGREMSSKSVAVGAQSGSLRIVGRKVDHGRVDLVRFTDLQLPTQEIAPGRWQADAIVSTSSEGLGDAVRKLGFTRGKPFMEAEVKLTVSPPGAEVRLVAPGGELVSSGRPDRARRVLLPIVEQARGLRMMAVALARGRETSARAPVQGPPFAPVTLTIPAGSRLEVSAKHAATGEYLPVRIRVLPREATQGPNLGPDWAAGGALDTVIAPSGRASIPLPAGYYRVLVSHGPEFTLHDERMDLGVGETAQVEAVLERVVDPGAWVPCEFHVHAAPSPDSEVSLYDRVASLVAEGIAFAIPTDHNHVTDYSEAAAQQPLVGLATVPGVEVTTFDPTFGHFNAFPFPIDPEKPGNGAPEVVGAEPAQLFAALHAIDPELVVQVNHPRLEGGIGYFDVTEYDPATGRAGPRYSDDYDTLEVWNGFDLGRFELAERVFREWLAMLARGRRIVATGSSDSHTIRSEGAGYPRTYVRGKLVGAWEGRELVAALRQGRAFVTSGPFLSVLVGGKGPGEEVRVTDGRVVVDVVVQLPSWMAVSSLRVYLGDQLVQRIALGAASRSRASSDGLRYERKVRLEITRTVPLVVAVEGDKELKPFIARGGVKPFAFINPIWLVVPDPNAPEPPAVVPPSDAGVPQAGTAPH